MSSAYKGATADHDRSQRGAHVDSRRPASGQPTLPPPTVILRTTTCLTYQEHTPAHNVSRAHMPLLSLELCSCRPTNSQAPIPTQPTL